jgi:hypothetical protein
MKGLAVLVLGLLLRGSPAYAQKLDPELSRQMARAMMREAEEGLKTVSGAPDYETDSGVELQIETRRSRYKAGDSIAVRITIRNDSDHWVRYPGATVSLVVPLIVLDAESREVGRTVPATSGTADGWAGLQSGHVWTFKNQQLETWVDLREWGYDLRTPGSYTITAPRGARTTISISR